MLSGSIPGGGKRGVNILYFGFFSDEEIHAAKVAQQEPYYIAQFSYEQALCKEFLKKPELEIEFVTIYQTSYYPKDRFIWRKKKNGGTPFSVLGFVNLPFLRELSYFFSTAGKVFCWAWKTRKTKDRCVFSSTHFTPVSAAIVLFTGLFQIKRVVTFTDLSLFTYQEERIRKMPLYKRAVIRPYVRFTDRLQESYDGYVLFSEKMNDIVNPKHKPYCVVEGIYNPNGLDLASVPKKNAIAHAGTLMRQVGIGEILETYERLSLPSELWLIGDGDMREEILNRAGKDARIKFFGFLPRTEVFEKLKSARLLVILRDPKDEYTKYSFPSKVFEYMVSGTPVVITKLEGIPEEYYRHMYCVDSLVPAAAAARLEELLAFPQVELDAKGAAAREFVLREKSAGVQGKKVISFLKKLF